MCPLGNFKQLRKREVGTKFSQKNKSKKISVKIAISVKQCTSVLHFSYNLENIRFWDKICSQKINGKKSEKIDIQIVIPTM